MAESASSEDYKSNYRQEGYKYGDNTKLKWIVHVHWLSHCSEKERREMERKDSVPKEGEHFNRKHVHKSLIKYSLFILQRKWMKETRRPTLRTKRRRCTASWVTECVLIKKVEIFIILFQPSRKILVFQWASTWLIVLWTVPISCSDLVKCLRRPNFWLTFFLDDILKGDGLSNLHEVDTDALNGPTICGCLRAFVNHRLLSGLRWFQRNSSFRITQTWNNRNTYSTQRH